MSSSPPSKRKRLCKCRSHCLQYNPDAQIYEGEGHIISRSLQNQHKRDDELAEFMNSLETRVMDQVLLGTSASPSVAMPSVPPDDRQNAGNTALDPIAEHLHAFEREVAMRSNWITVPQSLEFAHDPADHGPFQRPDILELRDANSGLHALKTGARVNYSILQNEYRLCEILDIVGDMNDHPRREKLEDRIYRELATISMHKEVEWSRQRGAHHGHVFINTEVYFTPIGPQEPVLVAIYLTVLTMHVLFHLPRRATQILLAGMRSILRLTAPDSAKSVPKDPRTVSGAYRLDPVTETYLCCPSCYCLYPYEPGSDTMPDKCTHRPLPTSPPCDVPLWRTAQIGPDQRKIPRRKYVRHSMKHWLARLLSRPGIEEILDQPKRGPAGRMQDIWDGQVFRGALGADRQPFFPGPPGEGRFIFSLAVDSFNPFHMKEAKQTVSSTGIWMVLYNLPPHLRYLPENMYLVGVIPGPDKPSIDQINHCLELIVHELLEFWKPGVWFTRTAQYRDGRLVKTMLIPLVSDMLAVRQAAGYGSATSRWFCTCCRLEIGNIENIEKDTWPPRDFRDDRHWAKKWRDAKTAKERKDIFDDHGVRWSPLYLLPYWNPVRYITVDSMHALDLGLFQTHTRQVWGINVNVEGSDGVTVREEKIPPKPPHQHLVACLQLIRKRDPDLSTILSGNRFIRATLWHICYDNGLRYVGNKAQLADNIVKWRDRIQEHEVIIPDAPIAAADMEVSMSQASMSSSSSYRADLSLEARSEAEQALVERGSRMLAERRDEEDILAALKQFHLRCLCFDRGLPTSGKKSVLYGRLSTWTEHNNIPILSLPDESEETQDFELYEDPEAVRGSHVLGKRIMAAVHQDMEYTVVPSWISKAPGDWGTTKRGKLSANHWRVICTIHLPITLIRIWGRDDSSDREKKMLENFMDLVRAVQIANMRAITSGHITAYHGYMHKYLYNFKELYKGSKIKPIHHISLHIDDVLENFGPVHAHSAPFFERYIYFLQGQNINMKFGELESTFMTSSARAANLRALLLHDSTVKEHVNELVQTYATVSSEDVRGTRLASMLDASATRPPYDLQSLSKPMSPVGDKTFNLLLDFLDDKHITKAYSQLRIPVSRNAHYADRISIRGVRYATASSFFRDSNIIFRRTGNTGKLVPRPGEVREIFSMLYSSPAGEEITGTFLAVLEFALVDDQHHLQRAYKGFGFAGGSLCLPLVTTRIIDISQVVAHFARTPLRIDKQDMIHVLPMDRLMEMPIYMDDSDEYFET